MTGQAAGAGGPMIRYRRGFLQAPGAPGELREILIWWETALVRRAQAKLAEERTEEAER